LQSCAHFHIQEKRYIDSWTSTKHNASRIKIPVLLTSNVYTIDIPFREYLNTAFTTARFIQILSTEEGTTISKEGAFYDRTVSEPG
jgi:hypothetical protein